MQTKPKTSLKAQMKQQVELTRHAVKTGQWVGKAFSVPLSRLTLLDFQDNILQQCIRKIHENSNQTNREA